MSYETWEAAPRWKRCAILKELGMSWKEIATVCGVDTKVLKAVVKEEASPEWLEAIDRIPIPRNPHKKLPREWAERAACKGVSISYFVPSVGTPISIFARECCAKCQVAQECLDEVLMQIDDCTYRAFTTPRIRRRYRRYFEIDTETDETDADNNRDD